MKLVHWHTDLLQWPQRHATLRSTYYEAVEKCGRTVEWGMAGVRLTTDYTPTYYSVAGFVLNANGNSTYYENPSNPPPDLLRRGQPRLTTEKPTYYGDWIDSKPDLLRRNAVGSASPSLGKFRSYALTLLPRNRHVLLFGGVAVRRVTSNGLAAPSVIRDNASAKSLSSDQT